MKKHELVAQYHFGENCHYYDLQNWKEFVRKPPTKADWDAQNKIADDFRRQSEKRWRENTKEE